MGLTAFRKAVLALPGRYDDRLELGGLPAVSALMLAWPISVAVIGGIRFAVFGEISFRWCLPWIAFPLFWPALLLLPVAAHIPTKLLPWLFALGGLIAGHKIWTFLFKTVPNISSRDIIYYVNTCAEDVIPTLLYGFVIYWLLSRRRRSGPAGMRGFSPYRAALLALGLLAILWFVIPFLLMLPLFFSMPWGANESGALIIILMFVYVLIDSFPWGAIVTGIAVISMVHGVPRFYGALAFVATALAFCPLDPSDTSKNLLSAALENSFNLPNHQNYAQLSMIEFWRPLACSAVGVAIYGLSLWLIRRRRLIRRKMIESGAALETPGPDSIHESAGRQ